MKFRARQFVSGYQYFEFEAHDHEHAVVLLKDHNSGDDTFEVCSDEADIESAKADSLRVLKMTEFNPDDGGEVVLLDQ